MMQSIARSLCRRFVLAAAFAVGIVFVGLASSPASRGDDWPQWRGVNRDGKVTDFKAPKAWPKELTQKWKVAVGDGVATPALVGDKLFVFSREDKKSEVTRCLNAATGKEEWIDKYDTAFEGKGDTGYQGPRSSPAVADGKVVTFGVNGTLSCLDAATGKKLWRIETKGVPRFHTSSSPLIVDKLVIVQTGSEGSGAVAAYELDGGKEKWKWADEGASYASPVLMTVDGTKMVVAETNSSVVALGAADGKLLWKTAFPIPGMRNYNASTPVVQGETVIFSGSNRGTKAIKVEKKDGAFTTKELWNNKESAVMYNTPVLKNGFVFGLTSGDSLFCLNAETGKTAWTQSVAGNKGYGNIVDAGPVLFAMTPNAKLLVLEPSEKEYTEIASYKVGENSTFAYPVITGNRIFVKDKTSVILWTVE